MTDLVSQLVEELEYLIDLADSAMRQANNDGAEYDRDEMLAAPRAALTAAKAGGWVAVPEQMTDEMRDAGNEWMGNRFLLGKAYAAMLAARPTTPPKEQA